MGDMLDLSRADGKGDAGFRNALAKRAAAMAVKRPKALAPAQVIDLSDDKSDDEAHNLQKNTQDIIDLINSDSPAVNLHGHSRLASTAPSSGHPSQPHRSGLHVTQANSRGAASYPDNATHHKPGSLSALPGSNISMPITHSSRKRTASSLDTVPACNFDEPTSSVPIGTLSGISSSSTLHRSVLTTSQASSGSLQGRMATTKQHEGRRGLPPSDLGERPIDLVNMTGSARHYGAPRGLMPSEAGGRHIDLVKVTENYSGALQAASRRVQHASTDPALARALAEKAELERQLKEALANKQAWHPNQPLRAPMPSHWTDMPQDANVEYVELPLPPGCGPAYDPPADQHALAPLDEGVLKAMMYQLPKADAEAALRHCNGDGDAALLYAVHCHSQGGAAAVAQRGLAAASTSSQDFAQMAAEQARKEADLQEAQLVLARVTANNSTIQLSHVVRIERVQNPHLWTKYCLRRHEVELAAGTGNVNEQLLFHGCSKDTLAIIGAEGFDIRVSGMSCSLGAGTYFAGNSSYSVSYVDKGPGMTAVPGAGMPVPWGGFGFAAGMPGWPPGALMPAFTQPPGSRASNILPHPSMRGILKSPKKGSAHVKGKLPKKDPSKPHFTPDSKAMFLCRVALGRLAVGQPGMRLPPNGSDSVSSNGRTSIQTLGQSIFAVFDNSQAYPEFVIHFRQQ